MKKRRELDALVNGKTNGRRKRKGQHDLLLEHMSDSSENEEFSVPGKTVVRKRGFCQFCATCVTVCGFFMLVACIIAIIALVWVHIELKQELDDLKDSLSKVESGSQGNPEEFQTLHTELEGLKKTLTEMQSGDKGLESIENKAKQTDKQISDLNKKFEDLKKKVNEAAHTSLPNELQEINQHIADMGSEVKTAQEDISTLQTSSTHVQHDMAALTDQLAQMSAAEHSDNAADTAQLAQHVESLSTMMDQVNTSLSVKIIAVTQTAHANQLKIKDLTNSSSTLWIEVNLLKLGSTTPDVDAPPTNNEAPPPSADTSTIEMIIHEALHNYSVNHNADMMHLNGSIQTQLDLISSSISSLETQERDIVSGEVFLEFKNTAESQYQSLHSDMSDVDARTSHVEGRVDLVEERVSRVEIAQQAGVSPIDAAHIPEGHESDASGVGPAGDENGGHLIGGDDGHIPDWLNLPTTQAVDSTIEESTAQPAETDVTNQGVFHSKTIITSQAAQILESIDQSVDPCDDFFQYACGSWNRKRFIPEDKGYFDIFELHEQLQITLKILLEEPVTVHDTPATLKAKTLYESCTNTTQIERVGDGPLKQVLGELGGWPVMHKSWNQSAYLGLEETMGRMRGLFNAPGLFPMRVATDDKNSSSRVIQIDQTSLGMPSRDYYLGLEEKKYKNAYLQYMIASAILLGADPEVAKRDMTEVLEFETQLAEITIPQNERHDTGAIYKKLTIGELMEKVPEIDWLRYFNSFMPLEMTSSEEVVCFALEYMKDMGQLVNQTQNRVIANYLLWRLVHGLAPELPSVFQDVRNDYRKVMQGVSRDKQRWQKCVIYVNERMGMAVGRLFVHDHFDEESKETALEMIDNIREAFKQILEANEWMDDETKAVAKEKANYINERIGYPEFILDDKELTARYDGLEFEPDSYFENILRVERHDSQQNLKKLREPVLKDMWEQAPAVLNAFYNPNTNDIVFPAGILQPLFYDKNSPKSLNYGGIGVIIGHEITHGFDDKGRQYDKDGNLRQWWNNETIEAFRERAQCMAEQYSQAKLQPFGLNIDGRNTEGENIADNGGLKESFKAYRKWVSEHGEEAPLPGIDLTHNQLFFLNYAQIWCGIMRSEEALRNIRTDVHSPGPIRVQVPLSNSDDFSEAYSCARGSRMNPVHKCSVW